MQRFEIYCNIEFLFSLYELINQPVEDLLSDVDNFGYYYIQLYKIIHEHSDVIIDIEEDELIDIATNPNNERYNPNLKKFIKTGRNCFHGLPKQFEYMDIDEENYFVNINNPKALFLLNKSENECHKLKDKYGMLFISNSNIKAKLNFIFDIDIVPITKLGNITDWTFLKKYKHPFNSMVIADNYLLKENINDNLFQLLKSLLPATLNISEFHLTILTTITETSSFNIEKRYLTILDYLNETFDYKINLTIIQTNDIHDRNIITNYFWINSGYGFSLFKGRKLKNETNLFALPFFNIQKKYVGIENANISTQLFENKVSVAINILIEKYKLINTKAIDIGIIKNVVGNKKNRLLD